MTSKPGDSSPYSNQYLSPISDDPSDDVSDVESFSRTIPNVESDDEELDEPELEDEEQDEDRTEVISMDTDNDKTPTLREVSPPPEPDVSIHVIDVVMRKLQRANVIRNLSFLPRNNLRETRRSGLIERVRSCLLIVGFLACSFRLPRLPISLCL